jgi:hypothetical protein
VVALSRAGVAFVVGVVRSPDRALLGWVAVPLVLITVLDLLRPMYFDR